MGTGVESHAVDTAMLRFADDVVCLAAHHNPTNLRLAANISGEACFKHLKRMGCSSEIDKSANAVVAPNSVAGPNSVWSLSHMLGASWGDWASAYEGSTTLGVCSGTGG